MLAEDLLSFEFDLAFTQNSTAFPFQNCAQNSVIWSGSYEVPGASGILELKFVRCTQSGPGCLACTPTSIEYGEVAFNVDCDVMTLALPSWSAPRTYFPVDQV